MAIKCLNNYHNILGSTLLHEEHGEEYTFPLAHPHWALSVIHNAWRGAPDDVSGCVG